MRLSDAGMCQRQTKMLYPNHRLPPWLNEDATRDRSNRLLDFVTPTPAFAQGGFSHRRRAQPKSSRMLGIAVAAILATRRS
jgi:hypothetical protein